MPVPARISANDHVNLMRAAAEAARRSLASTDSGISEASRYQKYLQTITPNWKWNWRHQLHWYEALARVTRGECDRLMILGPPRHTKTETVSVRYSSYRIERDPECRVILGAYNQEYANKISRKSRRVVRSRIKLSSDHTEVNDWETIQGGGLRAAGVGSGVTGYGANVILIEDPVKSRKEANSQAYRDTCWDWYNDDLYTRLEPDAAVILIMTPWHIDDLSGRLLQEMASGGEQWEVVRLPALAEADDPLGRKVGEALCPDRFDEKALARIQAKMSPQSWSALYQGRPIPIEGTMFKRDWFTIVQGAPANLRWFRYWDLALTEKKKNSRTASVAVALDKDGVLYLRDGIFGHWEWPDAKRRMIRCMLNEPRTKHGVELKMHGLAAMQELRRDRRIVHVPLRGCQVDGDKVARADSWTDRAQEKKVKIVQGPWVAEALKEICEFPDGALDDIVDSISGGVKMLAKGGGRIYGW